MTSIADQLPPEIARQIHPDRRRNEAAYWAVRDQLLAQYRGQWIGFADGKVVASGTSPVAVFQAAEATGLHPFLICVGRKDEPCHIRRAAFPYDANYPGEALPLLSVEFRQASGSSGVVLDRVVPDTGADASVLSWLDCQLLQLTPDLGVQGLIRASREEPRQRSHFWSGHGSMARITPVGCKPTSLAATGFWAETF